jgi:hypothetical protein
VKIKSFALQESAQAAERDGLIAHDHGSEGWTSTDGKRGQPEGCIHAPTAACYRFTAIPCPSQRWVAA